MHPGYDGNAMATKQTMGRETRWRRYVWRLLLAGVLGCVMATVGANLWIWRATRGFIHYRDAAVRAPIAIVPGASVLRDGRPSPQLEDRLIAALALHRAGRVPRVLVSGARHGAYDEAGPMRKWLLRRGVPAAAVAEDHEGFRTLDTMRRARRVFAVSRAVVCTQAFHLPRAVFLARRAGIDAIGLIADGPRQRVGNGDIVREWFASVRAVIDVTL